MVPALEIQLLGGFAVSLAGRPVQGFRSAKTRALLAYLAAQPAQAHSRDTLATLLWGDLADTAAKTNLRIELSNLKRVLSSHPAIDIARTSVRLDGRLAGVDVAHFRAAVDAFAALPTETQAQQLSLLTKAIDNYRGEFLAGFHVGDALDFEDWLLIQREQLHVEMMNALETLQLRYAEQGLWQDLAEAARKQLAFAPWSEPAHRHVMQALAAQGQTQAALAQYARCCAALLQELGVEPSSATQALAARLRGETPAPTVIRHNLPRHTKSFVGRDEEVDHLLARVRVERLVTLLGIGGVGKSRLAQAVARRALDDFADGVWFVPLVNIAAGTSAAERIATALAAAVGFQVTDMQQPLAEVATYLADKRMLLVLDNWEHLIEAAPVLLDVLLFQTPVHILATSRVRLMVEGEVPVVIGGLPLTDAAKLFIDRARAVLPTFSEQATDGPPARAAQFAADIQAVCAQVAGLPLGIELAASWVEHFSVAEIVQSIAGVRVAPQQAAGLVSRHHALSNVFEFSWQLLSPRNQQVFACLGLFRGGFDRAASSEVAATTLAELSVLISHSLLQRKSAGRYELHPLLQEFAAAKLSQAEALEVARNYADYYLARLIETRRGDRAIQLHIEFDNIRHAWLRAVQQVASELLERALVPFAEFLSQFGVLADAENLLKSASTRLEQMPDQHELIAKLLDQQAFVVRRLRGLGGVVPLLERVIQLSSNPHLLANAHSELANYYGEMGRWEKADHHFDRAEECAAAASDLGAYITIAEARIHINAIHFRGDFGQAMARAEELLSLLDTATESVQDAEQVRTYLLSTRMLVTIRYGDYGAAIRKAHEALAVADALGQRARRGHTLLDLALAEQFAGMYTAAIAHNEEALALAEEVGDTDDSGLLKANLCLTWRQQGDLERALAYGLQAIEILSALSSLRVLGQARNRTGHTLLALARWDEAYAMYYAALAVWAQLAHPNRTEALAGCAVAALRRGNLAEASALVDEVLAFVDAHGLMGIVEPARLLLNCAEVLSSLSQNARAHAVLETANAWVQLIAGRISDASVRHSFLENRPDNVRLQALHTAVLTPVQ